MAATAPTKPPTRRAAEALADALGQIGFHHRDAATETWRGWEPFGDGIADIRSATVEYDAPRRVVRIVASGLVAEIAADGSVAARGRARLSDVRLLLAALLRLAEGGREGGA